MTHSENTGNEGFAAGLKRCGCKSVVRNGVITFVVVPVGGKHAGQAVETGVSADELTVWPTVPPHWVHLPAFVNLSQTNSEPSPISGWLKHSRNITGWGNAEEPVQAWLAHVRSVLEEC